MKRFVKRTIECVLYLCDVHINATTSIFPLQGSPFPTPIDDETSRLLDAGIYDGCTLLVDEES